MESSLHGDRLVGWEIHGFLTMKDLDIQKLLEDAKERWFRPHEVHAILSNYRCFEIHRKPVNLPKGGTIVLYDRKKLRTFRKDGHNWRKKKDGKTVQEAHAHLKVGREERIHVYYAHGLDNPNLAQDIVFVHYRELGQVQSSPITPLNSNSNSAHCLNASVPEVLADEKSCRESHASNSSGVSYEQQNQYNVRNSKSDTSSYSQASNITVQRNDFQSATGDESSSMLIKESLQNEESFEAFMDSIIADAPDLLDLPDDSSLLTSHNESGTSMIVNHQLQTIKPLFTITDISPSWAYSTEQTKIIAIGYFHGAYPHIDDTRMFCVFGDVCSSAERIAMGVFRCTSFPRYPGVVNFYLSLDGYTPISQVLSFEYRFPPVERMALLNEHPKKEKFQLQLRLLHLLFSSSNILCVLSRKSTSAYSDTKLLPSVSSSIDKDWESLIESIQQNKISMSQSKNMLTEFTLKSKLKEWILERVVEGGKTSARDHHDLGIIHLCTILDYKWAVQLYSRSGLSLDFRDAFGWTALHWSAFYERKEMVAVLLSEGADPSLVTDPTSKFPGGCTAADIASRNGHEGIAAYLAKQGLITQFMLMSVSENTIGPLQTQKSYSVDPGNLSEEQLCQKDAFDAYEISTDVASRIQEAFWKDLVSKTNTMTIQDTDEDYLTFLIALLYPEAIRHTQLLTEGCYTMAAMKIHHAFRIYMIWERMKVASRIQHQFHTWEDPKGFSQQAFASGQTSEVDVNEIIWQTYNVQFDRDEKERELLCVKCGSKIGHFWVRKQLRTIILILGYKNPALHERRRQWRKYSSTKRD
ncbi:hypothetical protein MKW98_032356 [Papaver atlanticum]|uniref:CG-1 domain-containing protein n=1 Tax=Papaver atlanticum TaxID=357466 RepID=A0AAD4SG71_9MAGN|nr:hypothetical protein MKW98_032356 [Papaver atlanticum]